MDASEEGGGVIPTHLPPLWGTPFTALKQPGHDLPAIWASFGPDGGNPGVEVDLTFQPLPAGKVLRFETNELPRLEAA